MIMASEVVFKSVSLILPDAQASTHDMKAVLLHSIFLIGSVSQL